MTFKQYRAEKGLKQIDLVDLMRENGVEITQPILSMIENNKLEPTLEQAAWLAGASAKVEEMTPNEHLVMEFLKYAPRPITRQELKSITKLTDVANRQIIASLRAKGEWIVENGSGYYLTKDRDEFLNWSARYTSYARTILRTDAAMRRRLAE